MMETILLVEDDATLRAGLTELFDREGYSVTPAATAREARAALKGETALVVLDVSLPDGDGVSLCKEWRQAGITTPILFLTARDEELDVVRGLDAGGNDYVSKPFRMMELLSRIRALLRQGREGRMQNFTRSGFAVDKTRMQVSFAGEVLALTLTEYRMLLLLMEARGIVPRGVLLSALWDAEGKYIDDNTLSVHMSRLREKIGPQHIKTVRGVGYQWAD